MEIEEKTEGGVTTLFLEAKAKGVKMPRVTYVEPDTGQSEDRTVT